MLHDILSTLGYALPPNGSVVPFVLLTLAAGGGAAWRTGQAVAERWGELWPVAAYTLLIAAAVRFLHYALFDAELLSLASYAIDAMILIAVGLLAHRVRRARHITEQYPWMFERTSPLTWRART
ncbi:MAG TPA: hypothetical protein PK857_12075 [Hyphomicrobium sp.]|nr:hypothetical protein [Hyphomicrobium sp.]